MKTLFHEVYGSYYRVVASILAKAVDGALTDAQLRDIVREQAFAESVLTIPAALQSETWPFLTVDRKTPLHSAPDMPLTTLEKRWLKALLQDPRIRLFSPSTEGLEDVEPLYAPDVFVYYDQYGNGDPYKDETYIAFFHTILTALREKRKLSVRYRGGRGRYHEKACIQKVFEMILNAAVKNNVPQTELPSTLYIISDMEFDACARNAGSTNFEQAKRLYAAHGYQLPRVVFWNVASRNRQQPVTQNEQGVALVSGCTPRIFTMLQSGSLSPLAYMMQVLGSERYRKIAA